MSQETYNAVFLASHWLFVFFALMLLLFAFAWHHTDRKERKDRFKNLPGAGTIGELVVLSGSNELPPDTWFPVPREGILGSLRSCDLVVPCPGVRSQHLDFSWQDGTGLLIRPRIGCEVLIDGVPVSRRGAYADTPLLHGSVLQIGSAVLRLQLFSALSHTNRPFVPQTPVPGSGSAQWFPPVPPVQPPVQDPYTSAPAYPAPPVQNGAPVPAPPQSPAADTPGPDRLPVDPARQPQPEPRRKRADRWKEDWSE